MARQQFYQDATVNDAAGEKVGTLHAHDEQGGYITVQKGFLFHKDLYVPLSAVQGTDADGNVQLSLYKDDLQDSRYDEPPVGGASGEDSYSQRATVADTTTTRAPMATRVQDPAPPPAPRQAQTSTVRNDETINVPVYEEELSVGKRQQERGQVHLHKDVVQEQQSVSLNLRHEEITVERVPLSGQVSDADLATAFQIRDIEVPLMGEVAVMSKQAHVVEEVRLHKDQVSETEQVSDTVRKERVIVDEVDSTTRNQTRAPLRQ